MFGLLKYLQGWGNDAKSWYYWKNLATSKGAISLYIFGLLFGYSGSWFWAFWTAAINWLGTAWYDKGELLSFLKSYSGGHKQDKGKLAYWAASTPLNKLPICWEYKYGVAAALPYVVAMAPWGMPLLPLLYGVIYKHSPNDAVGRTLLGVCMGAAFVL